MAAPYRWLRNRAGRIAKCNHPGEPQRRVLGIAIAALAVLRPDLFGPCMIVGSPMS